MLSVPVLDIAEAAAHVAHLIGRRFSVVTTLARSVPPIEDRLLLAGLDAHCASVRACGLGTAEVDADPAGAVHAIVDEGGQGGRRGRRRRDLPRLRRDGRCHRGDQAPSSGFPPSTVLPPPWRWPRHWSGSPEHQQGRRARRGARQPRTHWPLSTSLGIDR